MFLVSGVLGKIPVDKVLRASAKTLCPLRYNNPEILHSFREGFSSFDFHSGGSDPSQRTRKGWGAGGCPGFPVEAGGVDELHAAFLAESRTRGRW